MPDPTSTTAAEPLAPPARGASDLVLDLRGVTKRYHEGTGWREVLTGADLGLERGALGALVGRSGAGKSTLLNLISGIDRPDAGSVVVDGTHLESLTERERTLFRRRHLGFVFQFYNLVPTLTVEENVRFLLDLNGTPRQRPATEPMSFWRRSGWRTARAPSRIASRAASSSASPSRGRSRTSHRSSWRTSPRATSTRKPASASWTFWRP